MVTDAEFDRVLAINAAGPLLATQHAARRTGAGRPDREHLVDERALGLAG